MKKLPNAVKWLIILVVLVRCIVIVPQSNAPDNTFGIYHTAESGT